MPSLIRKLTSLIAGLVVIACAAPAFAQKQDQSVCNPEDKEWEQLSRAEQGCLQALWAGRKPSPVAPQASVRTEPPREAAATTPVRKYVYGTPEYKQRLAELTEDFLKVERTKIDANPCGIKWRDLEADFDAWRKGPEMKQFGTGADRELSEYQRNACSLATDGRISDIAAAYVAFSRSDDCVSMTPQTLAEGAAKAKREVSKADYSNKIVLNLRGGSPEYNACMMDRMEALLLTGDAFGKPR